MSTRWTLYCYVAATPGGRAPVHTGDEWQGQTFCSLTNLLALYTKLTSHHVYMRLISDKWPLATVSLIVMRVVYSSVIRFAGNWPRSRNSERSDACSDIIFPAWSDFHGLEIGSRFKMLRLYSFNEHLPRDQGESYNGWDVTRCD